MLIHANQVKDFRIDLNYTLQGLLVSGQIDRSFVVSDIGDSDGITENWGDTAPTYNNTKGTAALHYVSTQFNISIGTPHPAYPELTARNFSVKEIGMDDALMVVIGYLYQQIPYDPTIWTIESSTYTEFLETDQQYNSSNGSIAGLVPIQIANYVLEWGSYQTSAGGINASPQGNSYQTPSGVFTVAPVPPAYGTVNAAKLHKRWDYVKTIYDPSAAMTFDAQTLNYTNRVNSVPFLGNQTGSTAQSFNLATGTAYCYDAGVSFNLTSGQYLARCTIIWKPEGWQPWTRYTNPKLGGVPPNIWRPGMIGGSSYGANGTVQALEYLSTDLNVLLTLI